MVKFIILVEWLKIFLRYNNLSVAYKVSMLLIAIFLFLSFISVYFNLEKQEKYAELINISGKQRMISQKLFANMLIASSYSAPSIVNEIDLLIKEVKRSIVYIEQKEQDSSLYDNDYINRYLQVILENSKLISKIQPKESLFKLIEKRENILKSLDDTVRTLQKKSDDLNQSMVMQVFILLFLLIVSLLIISLFVFKPLASNIEERHKDVTHLALTDHLTGLFNRRHFNEVSEDEVKRFERYGHTFSIAIIDIDHFKRVNDTYGHQVGDEILKELSMLLLKHLRATDTLARWGGEEFIAILPNANLQNSRIWAEKTIRSIRTHNFKHISKLTCSIGLSTIRKNETTSEVIERADSLLYKAKENGRDQLRSS